MSKIEICGFTTLRRSQNQMKIIVMASPITKNPSPLTVKTVTSPRTSSISNLKLKKAARLT